MAHGAALGPVRPVPQEIRWGKNDLIVSKTDLKGVITYANDVFINVCGYTEAELVGQPHNLIRHPDFPGGVFKLLWDTISAGQEIFAYVKNLAKDGRYYWVLAHVTPTFDARGRILGYHSSRRCPSRSAIAEVEPVYGLMMQEETKHSRRIEAAAAGLQLVGGVLASKNVTYDEFIWDIITRHEVDPIRRAA